MFQKIECVAIYTEDLEKSVAFYESLGLVKSWEAEQGASGWQLIGMRFPQGESELVLKNNPDLNFVETEIMVDDVCAIYEQLRQNPEVQWISTPVLNSLGGHVAVMEAPDGNVFVLVGR